MNHKLIGPKRRRRQVKGASWA